MFGGRFKLTGDPSLAAERSDRRSVEGGRLTRISCGIGGFIAPAGGRRLLADDAEDGGVRADAQRERQYDDDREAGTA